MGLRLLAAVVLCLVFWFLAPGSDQEDSVEESAGATAPTVPHETSVAVADGRTAAVGAHSSPQSSPSAVGDRTAASAGGTGELKRPSDIPSVTGRWVLNDGIRRDVTMYPDGTATMDVQLDFFASLLYGAQMSLKLSWSLQDGVLTHTIVSGTPKKNVDRLIRDFGDSRSYKVLKLGESVLELQDFDMAKTVYRWQRRS